MAIAEVTTNNTDREIETQTLAEQVAIAATFVEPAYGRSLDGPLVRKLAREWDERALGIIMLSLRADGRYAVLDGQHRIEVARRMGLTKIPARVYIDLTLEEEARLYRLYAVRKQQTTLDRYRAGVAEGDPAVLRIKAIVEGLGMEVRHAQYGEGSIGSIAALARMYGRYGPSMLDLVLRTLYAAFGPTHKAYSGALLNGLASFIVRFEDRCDWTRLVMRLKDEGLTEITQRASAAKRAWGTESESTVGRIIMDIYNKGLSAHRLGPWSEISHSKIIQQRPSIVPPSVRLSQRKALADVPRVTVDTPA